MDVVLNIRGREAIPVWTIPYIAAPNFSADMLLHELTDTREFEAPFPSAFRPINLGDIFIIPRAQWEGLRGRIKLIEKDVNNSGLSEDETRKSWNQKSVELFWEFEPSYIWLDEFRSWYAWHIENEFVYDKGEDVEICLNPQLPITHAKHFNDSELNQCQHLEQRNPLADVDAGSQDDSEPTSTAQKSKLTKMEKQQAAILAAILAKGFKPMAIPDNEKGTIKSICELENKGDLFKAGTAFDAAWKNGIGKLWQMEHHDSYAHRGNN